ncbi:MAG: DUF4190 domain-containing protein [Clostridiales bacterium]|nr:DUF4190 domain-containing protein [Clostridiales bacterium]
MARYVRDEQINKPDDFVAFIMNDFLTKHGFTQKEVKGEVVWQDGVGMLAPPKFFKYSYVNGVVHIEAWMKTAWLPGVYTGENAMTGFIGAVPKSAYKKSVEELISLLYQPLPSDNAYMNAQPMGGAGQPIMVQGVDNSRYATMGLVFSLIALLGLITNPILGLLFAVMGIVYGNKAKTSSKKGMAKAGFIIGIIGTVIFSILTILWLIGIFALAAGF